MTRRTAWIAGGALAAALAAATGSGTAQAGPLAPTVPKPVVTVTEPEPAEDDVPITGDALARAGAAALAAVGGGTITETEVGDEEGYYEVEVTRADGSRLDVHLDERFTVLGSIADEAGEPQ